MIIGGRLARIVIIFVAVVGLIGLLYPPQANAESLSQLLQRQADLRRKADENKKKLEQTKGVVNDLTGIVGGLDQDIAETQDNITNTEAQIAVTEEVINELAVDIDQTQTELDGLQLKLRNAYISLYELSQASPLDTILASSSLTEMVSQSQYIQSLQTELQGNIDKTNTAKTELEGKKNESVAQKTGLVSLKQDLTKSKNSLNSRRTQKNYLLLQTQGQQAQYEALLKQLQNEQESISQAIYDARRQSGNGQLLIGGTGGYPWANEPDAYAVDPWLYYKRQCTSFAAWKFQAEFGLVFYNTRPGQGSAWNWPALARDQGFQTSSTPRANSVISIPTGPNRPYGHAAWVNRVNANGTIDIEEYNWSVSRSYGERLGVNPTLYGNVTYIFP
ncbi:MAG: CHAP domain-containing protein [Candidatus Berkelbacteria bacterium]|nr:CHAP domain-containing protein [Candidatus Berkelbacteria bacterium]MCR4307933.1 CHAP domain-containing protein [Candidatus Berkelbacteria bacterium]